MKKILTIAILLALTVSAQARVNVRGHYRSNGTYVDGYTRSSPDSSIYNNDSYKGW